MKITKQLRREAKELFRNCVVSGVLDENRVRETVAQMLAAKPRGYLGVLTHFQRLVKLDLERRSARIESVIPLDASMQSSLRGELERRYGHGLQFTFIQNPGLLGGIRIRVGSDVFDGSIQARLDEVRKAFLAA
jgi:F-type H+-transporting ATPase subunit delta